MAFTGCGPASWVRGEVQGQGAFRVSTAIMEGDALRLSEEPEQLACGKVYARFYPPARGLVIVGPATAPGRRAEIYPDTDIRAGLAPSGAGFASYFYDDVREQQWRGWVQTSVRTTTRVVGTFELAADGGSITGAFDATGCP